MEELQCTDLLVVLYEKYVMNLGNDSLFFHSVIDLYLQPAIVQDTSVVIEDKYKAIPREDIKNVNAVQVSRNLLLTTLADNRQIFEETFRAVSKSHREDIQHQT
jgi:hypothetical protein